MLGPSAVFLACTRQTRLLPATLRTGRACTAWLRASCMFESMGIDQRWSKRPGRPMTMTLSFGVIASRGIASRGRPEEGHQCSQSRHQSTTAAAAAAAPIEAAAMRCWSRTLQVGSVLTQAMGIAAAASQQPGPAALQLLVVPGNPGLCSFYQRFMSELWGLFDGRADVWAVSHAGHDSDNLTQGRVFCLESQIDHKVALLREHVLAPGRPPVVVLAHSIGSFIMLQAIQRLEEEQPDAARRIIKVVLLMPFLATDWGSSRQRLLKLLSGAAPVLGSIAAAVARLPEWMKDLVARLAAPGAEPDFFFRQGMHQLMSYNGVRNNFNLAWHEFRDLDLAEVDWQLIRRLGQRVSVVCAPDDLWFPAQHYQQMTAALPGVEEVRHESLSHAFCTDSWQCAEVARLVAGFVATAQASASQADMAVEVEDGERPKVVQAPAGAEIARVPVG